MAVESNLNRTEVLKILRKHEYVLKERFGVTEISLFGSFARDEATEESDVDVVVEFEGKPTLMTYSGAQLYLEEVFGRKVDLTTEKEIREEILPYVKRDMEGVPRPNKEREWRFIVADMINYCEEVLNFAGGLTKEAWIAQRITYDASLWNLARIGNAAKHIPPNVLDANSFIQQSAVVEMNEELIAEYWNIDDESVWDAIQFEVPALLIDLRELLKRLGKDDR